MHQTVAADQIMEMQFAMRTKDVAVGVDIVGSPRTSKMYSNSLSWLYGLTGPSCLTSNGCLANCTDSTLIPRPAASPSTSSSASATTSSASEPKLTQTTIVIIAVVGGVVVLGIIGGILAFFYKRRKTAQDHAHQMTIMDRSHKHEDDMAQHETARSQLNLVAMYGRELLAIMPGGSGRLQAGAGPSTTDVPGPGRVLGAV